MDGHHADQIAIVLSTILCTRFPGPGSGCTQSLVVGIGDIITGEHGAVLMVDL